MLPPREIGDETLVDLACFPDGGRFHNPQRFEVDLIDCEVMGKIPDDLDGAFVRVGGDWALPPMFKDDSPFNQDGYISSFRIKDGRCDYKGRWIQTPRYRANRAAGRQLYGYYRNPYTDDPSVRDPALPELRSVANTAPLAHAGRLFALKEDGPPFEIDPLTLETLGPWDFGGKYRAPTFTAHPKVDPLTGDLYCYGYEAAGLASNDLWFYVISAAGEVKREVRLKVPYVSMLHDIALTERHVIFPVFPYVTSLEHLRAGKVHWVWDQDAPCWYGVFPRDGEAQDIRWFRGPTRAIVHTLNGRTEGDKVILEAPIFDGNPFPFFPAKDGSRWDPAKGMARIRRITFDLASSDEGCVEEIVFADAWVSDLMRMDERYTSLPYRYGYTGFHDPARPVDPAAGQVRRRFSNCYGRFDMRDRTVDTYFAGPAHGLQEVCFAARKASSREGDGYLIGVANNFAEMRSELIIADAENLAGGDLARVILPFRADVQVHGTWCTPAQLPQLGVPA